MLVEGMMKYASFGPYLSAGSGVRFCPLPNCAPDDRRASESIQDSTDEV